MVVCSTVAAYKLGIQPLSLSLSLSVSLPLFKPQMTNPRRGPSKRMLQASCLINNIHLSLFIRRLIIKTLCCLGPAYV